MDQFLPIPGPNYQILPVLVLLLAATITFIFIKYRAPFQPSAGNKEKLDAATKGPSLGKVSVKQQQATTLEYIDKLEKLVRENEHPNIVGIYADLSLIIRQYVDMTQGTHTVTMSNEELRQLQLDQTFTEIIDECYRVEFSPNPGSVENCANLLAKSRGFIAS